VGYRLDEIPNDITGVTLAAFEPTLDYVVVKLPRFAFEKFPGADTGLTTQMKSVGEVMGIGRTFAEAWGKAMRSRELDGTPRTSVGVMPRGFWFPDPSVRVWTAEPLNPEGVSWNSTLIGRVAPGYDVHAMAAPVARLVAMLDERFDYPAQWDKRKGAVITPLRDDLMRGMKPALLATLGLIALGWITLPLLAFLGFVAVCGTVVYTVAAGSADAEKLEFLRVTNGAGSGWHSPSPR